MRTLTPVFLLLVLSGAGLGHAQSSHGDHAPAPDRGARAPHEAGSSPVLSEPGQGAFAALSEVVGVLEADPETDWSKVDLTALRDHLVDMDRLVTNAVVEEEVTPDGVRAVAGGDADTRATLRRMVPAHAAELARDDRWTVVVAHDATAVELSVTSDDPAVVARIRGLGFFGLMASQDHHREHHLLIATGDAAHP